MRKAGKEKIREGKKQGRRKAGKEKSREGEKDESKQRQAHSEKKKNK